MAYKSVRLKDSVAVRNIISGPGKSQYDPVSALGGYSQAVFCGNVCKICACFLVGFSDGLCVDVRGCRFL